MVVPQFDGVRNVLQNGLPTRIVFASVAFVAITLNFGLRSVPNLAVVAMVNYSAIPHTHMAGIGDIGCPGPIRKSFLFGVSTRRPSSAAAGNATAAGDPRQRQQEQEQQQQQGDNGTAPGADDDDGANKNPSKREDGPFAWDETIQQLFTSSFYWGYLVLQIPGGRWAEMYGGKRLISVSTFGSAVCTILVPLAARAGYVALIATRVCMGLVQAVMLPALTVLIARWAPPQELSRLNTLVKTGSMFGVFAMTPTAGWLINNYGWESVFYVLGVVSILWGVLWELLVFDSPNHHPRISEKERKYITEALGSHNVGDKDKMKNRKVPWKAILTSVPVWAVTIGTSLVAWSFVTLSSLMPTYMKVMLGFDITMNGMLNGFPYLGRVLFGLGYSCVADYVIRKLWAGKTTVRKFSMAGPGLLRVMGLFAMPFLGCDTLSVVAIHVAIGVLSGAAWSTSGPALVEMSPNFVGTVYGIFNMGFAIVAIISPVVSASFIRGNQTWKTWAMVFNVSGGTALAGILVFCFFGSAEEQPWNRFGDDEEDRGAAEAEEGGESSNKDDDRKGMEQGAGNAKRADERKKDEYEPIEGTEGVGEAQQQPPQVVPCGSGREIVLAVVAEVNGIQHQQHHADDLQLKEVDKSDDDETEAEVGGDATSSSRTEAGRDVDDVDDVEQSSV